MKTCMILVMAVILAATLGANTTFAQLPDSSTYEFEQRDSQSGVPFLFYKSKTDAKERTVVPRSVYNRGASDTSEYRSETEYRESGIPFISRKTHVRHRETSTGAYQYGYGAYGPQWLPTWGYPPDRNPTLWNPSANRSGVEVFIPDKYQGISKESMFPIYFFISKQGNSRFFVRDASGYEFVVDDVRGCSLKNGDGTVVWLPYGQYWSRFDYSMAAWIPFLVDPSQTGYKAAPNGAIVVESIGYENAGAPACAEPFQLREQDRYPQIYRRWGQWYLHGRPVQIIHGRQYWQ